MDITEETAETVARQFHEAYERLAPSFGYKTREASAVPWERVPEDNRRLMIAVAGEVAPLIAAQALRSVDADRIAQAIGDPGSIVGRRELPWRDGGEDGGQGETVTRWSTRAVLAVLAETTS